VLISRPATKFCGRIWVNDNSVPGWSRTLSLRIKGRCELQFVLICYTRRGTLPRSSTVPLPRINQGVSSTTLRPRGKVPNGGQRVLHRQRKWGGSHRHQKTMIIFFFFRRQGYCSTRICPARANGQPRSLHLRSEAHARGTSTSSSWPLGIWTVDSVARQCETTHSYVTRFLTKYNVTVLPHPPYSPDLSPCEFFSVSTTEKKRLKGGRHEKIKAIQAVATMELTGIPKELFTSCFQDLQKRWQQCIDCGGN
jgi:hypothetical protein